MSPPETCASERRAQEVYEVYLAHIDGCAPCQAEEDCVEVARIRRDLRAARAAVRESPALRAARAEARK
ncbi:hypothetical protein [Streptomyces kanamyceticus]|uniref:hypothetical protein n=1 Tax=Streptomyces kanamyceticus TaxID=1967 RepID=UPI000A767794|nr:hypothetical protein [Streptomyces kanamyceticus]